MSANTAMNLYRAWDRIYQTPRRLTRSQHRSILNCENYIGRLERLVHQTMEFMQMSTKGNTDKPKWVGFANIDIPSGEREKAQKVVLDYDTTVSRSTDVISRGYKLSVTHKKDTDSFIATLTCNDKKSPNAGYSLSGYGREWMIALGSVLYKHFDVAKEKWDVAAKAESDLFG